MRSCKSFGSFQEQTRTRIYRLESIKTVNIGLNGIIASYFAWFGEPSEKQLMLVFHLTKVYPRNDEMQIIFDNFYEISGVFWC